jgi:hypothetical protein
MHPEIARELTTQRSRDLQAQARQASLARMLRASKRRAATRDKADEFVVPAIPDFVDGSFLTVPADDQAASQPGQVPVTRRAA